MQFDIPKHEKSIIKVIGVGGGGSNAVLNMFKEGIVGVDFAICNTDNQALEASAIPIKIQLGPSLTEGRGAGSKPERGRQACIESLDEIKKYLSAGTKMLFITAGMGGGTGTGAAPIIAKAAREMDILTVGIITLPFTFEGRKRCSQGMDGLNELRDNVDTLIVISNDKLREIHGNMNISAAFAEADFILTTAAKGIAEIITVPGYVNVDFEDVNTVMKESGVAIMGTAEAAGEDRALRAVDAALNSPLLEENDIKGAQHILLNITSGVKEVTMDEIFEITEYVQEEAGYGTDLIWGNCYDETLGEKINVTIIATGFEETRSDKVGSEEQRTVVNLDDDTKTDTLYDKGFVDGQEAKTFEFDNHPGFKKASPYSYNEPYIRKDALEKAQSKDEPRSERKVEKIETLQNRANQIKLSNPQNVMELESKPAYLRRDVELQNTPHSSEEQISQWTVSVDDEEPTFSNQNTFLHDNVD